LLNFVRVLKGLLAWGLAGEVDLKFWGVKARKEKRFPVGAIQNWKVADILEPNGISMQKPTEGGSTTSDSAVRPTAKQEKA
jgi:hypothetical protein